MRARIAVAQDPVLDLRAVEVRLEPESLEGAVAGIDPAERLLVDGKTIRVRPQAVVLIRDASDGAQSLGSFGPIAIGDEIDCFGPSTCGEPVVHLDAFVVVIDRP